MTPYRCVYRGGHGGADPLYEPSPRLVFPPPRRAGAALRDPGLVAFGSKPKRANPSGGVSGVVLCEEYSYKIVTDFYRFFGLSWNHF